MYYTHPGCRTSIFGENRAYCIRDFTVSDLNVTSGASDSIFSIVRLKVFFVCMLQFCFCSLIYFDMQRLVASESCFKTSGF